MSLRLFRGGCMWGSTCVEVGDYSWGVGGGVRVVKEWRVYPGEVYNVCYSVSEMGGIVGVKYLH